MEEIVKMAKEKKIELVLSANNCPWDERSSKEYQPYAESDRKISDAKLVDMFKESENFPKERIYTFISEADIPEENIKKGDKDYWHPNPLGNAYIAMVILKQVFGIEFNPEKYIETNGMGYKYPEY